MTTRRRKVEVGSGNIFADLGLPGAEDMLLTVNPPSSLSSTA